MLTTLKSRSLYTKVVKSLPLVTLRLRSEVFVPPNLVFHCHYSTISSPQGVPVYSRALEFGQKTAVIDCNGSHSYHQLYRFVLNIYTRLEVDRAPQFISTLLQIQSRAKRPPLGPDQPGRACGCADPQHGAVCDLCVGGLDGGGRGGAPVQGPPSLLPPILPPGYMI